MFLYQWRPLSIKSIVQTIEISDPLDDEIGNGLPTLLEWSGIGTDKYLVVVLQLLGTSCSCYKNNFITKFWDPDITSLLIHGFLDTIF